MKKALSIILSLLLFMSLVSCDKNKSAAVIETENAISAIGNVSIDSKKAIEKAEKLYDILSDSEKEQVENRLRLVEAREKYDHLEKINIASKALEMLEQVSSMCASALGDIENVWELGLNETKKESSSTVFYSIASKTKFTVSEIKTAASSCNISGDNCVNGTSSTSAWKYCTWVVMEAHKEKGTYTTINSLLSQVELMIEQMENENPEYPFIASLTTYCSELSSYASFFESPTGTLSELSTMRFNLLQISDFHSDTIKTDILLAEDFFY